jgi:hypothetical protein
MSTPTFDIPITFRFTVAMRNGERPRVVRMVSYRCFRGTTGGATGKGIRNGRMTFGWTCVRPGQIGIRSTSAGSDGAGASGIRSTSFGSDGVGTIGIQSNGRGSIRFNLGRVGQIGKRPTLGR